MIYTCKPKKVSIYINTARKTAAQVKAETGCDLLFNAGFFTLSTFEPTGVLIADGKIHVYEWNGEGYCFDTLPPTFRWSNRGDKNFIYGVPLVVDARNAPPIEPAPEPSDPIADLEELVIDHEYRLTLMELGVN